VVTNGFRLSALLTISVRTEERLPSFMNIKGSISQKPLTRLTGLHPSVYGLFFAITLLLGAAVYHISQGPHPNHWDDAMYAISTFRWLDFIEDRGLLRGIFWGSIYLLPESYPPMVFLTSLLGGLFEGTLVAMRFAHLAWFVVTLLAVYGIGKELAGGWAGVLSVIIVGTMPLVFFWTKMIMGEPSLFATVAVLLLLLIRLGDELTLRRGTAIGFFVGLGTLTKQHFPALVVGPLGLWVLWLGNKCLRDKKRRKSTVLALLMVFATTTITAGPWYMRNLPRMARCSAHCFWNCMGLLSIGSCGY